MPYVISLFVAGLPIFYLELCLGQFSSLGPNCIFGKLAPIMKGIGWGLSNPVFSSYSQGRWDCEGMAVVSALVGLYYNMIIAWVLFYMFASFRSVLQWSSCMLEFDGFKCVPSSLPSACLL